MVDRRWKAKDAYDVRIAKWQQVYTTRNLSTTIGHRAYQVLKVASSWIHLHPIFIQLYTNRVVYKFLLKYTDIQEWSQEAVLTLVAKLLAE